MVGMPGAVSDDRAMPRKPLNSLPSYLHNGWLSRIRAGNPETIFVLKDQMRRRLDAYGICSYCCTILYGQNWCICEFVTQCLLLSTKESQRKYLSSRV
jgi:hypothetical protein